MNTPSGKPVSVVHSELEAMIARIGGFRPIRDTDAEAEARMERGDQEAAGRTASPTRDDDDELAEWCDREETAAHTKEEAVK